MTESLGAHSLTTCILCRCHSSRIFKITNGLTSKTHNQKKKPFIRSTPFLFLFSSRRRMLVPTRTVSEEAVEKGWLWSIQPLVTWAKWLGIDLSSGERQKCSWWFVLYSVFVLFISISIQLPCLNYVIDNHKIISITFTIENSYNSDTFSWNTVMDFVNFAVHSLGTHVIFLSVFRARWNLVGETFQNLELFLKFSFFDRIRKASILGLVWIILLVSTKQNVCSYFTFKNTYFFFYYFSILHC